ncbi:MAG: N-acetylglutaminylglutamine amidotransferase, partial [Wohlfahrtiimonas sp.]
MCGIAGILSFTDVRPEASLLEKMSAPLQRRGPDGGKVFCEGPIGFAHRRLGIIDVDSRADQPFHDNETGNTMVFNGTIYNYRELRSVLKDKGHKFHTESDTEVL